MRDVDRHLIQGKAKIIDRHTLTCTRFMNVEVSCSQNGILYPSEIRAINISKKAAELHNVSSKDNLKFYGEIQS